MRFSLAGTFIRMEKRIISDPAVVLTGDSIKVDDHRLDGVHRTPVGLALESSECAAVALTPAPAKPRSAKARPSPFVRARLLQLLTRLVGEDLAEQSCLKILNADERLDELVMTMACAAPFEQIFKLARTSRPGSSVRKSFDPAYVELKNYDDSAPFGENVRDHFAPRLRKRAEGFAAIFDALKGATILRAFWKRVLSVCVGIGPAMVKALFY